MLCSTLFPWFLNVIGCFVPRLIMVSNRVCNHKEPERAGGLTVAIHEALKRIGGVWFGWDGRAAYDDAVSEYDNGHYLTATVALTPEEYDRNYLGYANSVLWPVLHNRVDLAQFEADFFPSYAAVNRRFAEILARTIKPGDTVWVHDYHFMTLGRELRSLGVTNPIGFFLHTPTGPTQAMLAIPEHKKLAISLAAYDLVGLQTVTDVRNLIDFIEFSVGGRIVPSGAMRVGNDSIELGSFPVGVNVEEFFSAHRDVEKGPVRRIIGIDRLDYTKGLPQKFKAFGKFLNNYPEWRQRCVLSQFAPPTRESLDAYADLKSQLEAMSGEINGRFAELDWTPVNYIHRSLPRNELADVYASSSVGLVTPLRDGMNLVAKEFVIAQNESDPGVLILSKFAGAAEKMADAVLINPYDVEDIAAAIHTALSMPLDERRARHRSLFDTVARHDARNWCTSFLERLFELKRKRKVPRLDGFHYPKQLMAI